MFLDRLLFVGLLSVALLTGKSYCNFSPAKPHSKLLLISLDGFRHDYLEQAKLARINISAFERIWNTGFRAMRVKNEFITRTAPNHFSILTGLHEESHGIVDNTFYSPKLNATFHLSDIAQSYDSRWFDVGAEPIWVTNQRHGFQSAVNIWPGSNAKIKGYSISAVYHDFNFTQPFRHSITWMLDQLQKPSMTFGMLYHYEPDKQGHMFGPFSREVLWKIGSINSDLNYLLDRIETIPVLQKGLNIIVTSDHGMAGVNSKRVIILQRLIDNNLFTSPGPSVRVVWSLWPKPGFTAQDIYSKLAHKHEKMQVFMRQDIPKHLHYTNSPRIAPVVVFADAGWTIAETEDALTNWTLAGDHGYTPDWPEMSPFFLANGPGFVPPNEDRTIPLIHMVDIYPMMCYLLGLTDPAPNNGSLDRVFMVLQPSHISFGSVADQFFVSVICLLAVIVAVTFIAFASSTCRCLRTKSIRLLRRERLKKQQLESLSVSRFERSESRGSVNMPIRMHSLTHSGLNTTDDSRHLISDGNEYVDDDDEEVDLMVHPNSYRSAAQDDMAWINMLHGPKDRYS